MITHRHFNQKCPETRCIFHSNVSDIKNADAVLFYAPSLRERSALYDAFSFDFRDRTPEQIWVLMSPEPPPSKFEWIKKLNEKYSGLIFRCL